MEMSFSMMGLEDGVPPHAPFGSECIPVFSVT